jgi:nucleotidyltransferase substrate binding protein (TIGR01987 family)
VSVKLENFDRALDLLHDAMGSRPVNRVVLAGAVKAFEMVYELAWKLLKERLARAGHETGTSRDVFRKAYQVGWIDDEATWLEMIRDRNDTVHTYNEQLAREIFARIGDRYLAIFIRLRALVARES